MAGVAKHLTEALPHSPPSADFWPQCFCRFARKEAGGADIVMAGGGAQGAPGLHYVRDRDWNGEPRWGAGARCLEARCQLEGKGRGRQGGGSGNRDSREAAESRCSGVLRVRTRVPKAGDG